MKPLDQSEIDGAAHGQLPAGSDRRPQRNDDRYGDERDRNQNEHGEGQRRDEVAGDHSGVSEAARTGPGRTAWRTQLVEEERTRIGRRREIEIEAVVAWSSLRGSVALTIFSRTVDGAMSGAQHVNSLALAASLSARAPPVRAATSS